MVVQDRKTPLHVAAEHGHAAVLETLLKNGAAKDAANEVRSTGVGAWD